MYGNLGWFEELELFGGFLSDDDEIDYEKDYSFEFGGIISIFKSKIKVLRSYIFLISLLFLGLKKFVSKCINLVLRLNVKDSKIIILKIVEN